MTAEKISPPGGVRAQKRQETTDRILAAAKRLFAARGFEATSLDAVAEAAGISRRTFFNYFTAKEDILIAMQAGFGEALARGIAAAPPGLRPIEAVRQVMLGLATQYPPEEMLALDRIMRSSSAVQAAKQASYARHEQQLLAALRDRWPAPEDEMRLRLVALASIGALRLALEAWSREGGARPIGAHLAEAFAALEAGL